MSDQSATPRTAALMARQFDEARKIKDGIPREEIAAAWIDLAMLLERELAESQAEARRWQRGCRIGFPKLHVPEHTGASLSYWTNGDGNKYASAELAIDAAIAREGGEDGK